MRLNIVRGTVVCLMEYCKSMLLFDKAVWERGNIGQKNLTQVKQS